MFTGAVRGSKEEYSILRKAVSQKLDSAKDSWRAYRIAYKKVP